MTAFYSDSIFLIKVFYVIKYRVNGTMDDFERVRELGKGSFGSAILGKFSWNLKYNYNMLLAISC